MGVGNLRIEILLIVNFFDDFIELSAAVNELSCVQR